MTDTTYQVLDRIQANMESVVIGKTDVVKMTLVALLSGEHILLEDVPGVGKTLIAKALAQSLDGKFARIQFTPDLLPSDITGSSIYQSTSGVFQFSPGPVFANIVLADEINRAPPRTQSALLEAMSERQASVDGKTHRMPEPFLVIATQNPFEFEGTYMLPESQLDRFLLRIQIGYPDRKSERQILTSHQVGEPVEMLGQVVSLDEVKQSQLHVRSIRIDNSLIDYLQDLVEATRQSPELHVGTSTRGALSLFRAAQALAMVEHRNFVIPDDIKRLAVPVLAHRVIPRGFAAGSDRSVTENIICRLLEGIAVPV